MRQVLLYPDPEDGGWVALVPSLPGCISEGNTRDEALRNIREAITLVEEVMREDGQVVRRQSGSHIIMSKAGSPLLSIPNHNPIKRGHSARLSATLA